MIKTPDRDPDIEFENFDKITRTTDRIVKYWVEEGIREIVELDGHVEVDEGIDVETLYRRHKILTRSPELLNAVTDSVDRFLEAYEDYVMQKELLED